MYISYLIKYQMLCVIYLLFDVNYSMSYATVCRFMF